MQGIDRALGQSLHILAIMVGETGPARAVEAATRDPLSTNQVQLLRLLGPTGCFPIGKIARALGISNSAASKNVERLQKLGFVRRLPSPQDRRSQQVCLLDPGRDFVAAFDDAAQAQRHQMLGTFSTADKQALLAFLERLIRFALHQEPHPEIICERCAARPDHACVVHEHLGHCARLTDSCSSTVDRPEDPRTRPAPRVE